MAAAATLPWLAGCGDPPSPLNVGTIVFPGYELLFLARERGLLPEPGIRLVELLSSTDNLRLLAAGRLQAATLTLDEVLTARSDGLDLRVVLVMDVSAGADAVMAQPHVRGLSGLAGKRIGVEDGAMGIMMFDALLSAAGLRLDQVRKVPITVNRSVEVYDSGQVDALVTFEPWVKRLEDRGAVRLFDSKAIPNRILDVLAVRANAIPAHTLAIKQLVAAHFEGRRLFLASPAESGALIAARLQLPAADVPTAYRGLLLPDLAENRNMLRSGGLLEQSAQVIQRVFLAAGVLRQPVPLANLIDLQYLPA
jgi:NitT/TauT family transport system substrate-binding protein